MWHKGNEHLNQEEIKNLKRDFSTLFSSEIGQHVLIKIMTDLCFFRRCDTEEEVVLNNYAKKLMSYVSDWDSGSEELIIKKLIRR